MLFISSYSQLLQLLSVSNALFTSCLYEASPFESTLCSDWLAVDQCVVISRALRVCLGNVPPITSSLTHYWLTQPGPASLLSVWIIIMRNIVMCLFLEETMDVYPLYQKKVLWIIMNLVNSTFWTSILEYL